MSDFEGGVRGVAHAHPGGPGPPSPGCPLPVQTPGSDLLEKDQRLLEFGRKELRPHPRPLLDDTLFLPQILVDQPDTIGEASNENSQKFLFI